MRTINILLILLAGCAYGPIYKIEQVENKCINNYLNMNNSCESESWLETRHCYQAIQRKCVREEIFIRNYKPNSWTKVD